jgi:hypothetical protein
MAERHKRGGQRVLDGAEPYNTPSSGARAVRSRERLYGVMLDD